MRNLKLTQTSEMSAWTYENAAAKFAENMKLVLRSSMYSSLAGVDMVFLPIIRERHFYLMCMNLKDNEVQLFDNIKAPPVDDVKERYGLLPAVLIQMFEDYMLHENNPDHGKMRSAPKMVMETDCRTVNNYVDCGVFVMRHMETYKGLYYGDCCGLSIEGKEQRKELCDLRHKYAAKILLSDCNQLKKGVEMETHRFRAVHLEEQNRLDSEAFKKISRRAKEMLD